MGSLDDVPWATMGTVFAAIAGALCVLRAMLTAQTDAAGSGKSGGEPRSSFVSFWLPPEGVSPSKRAGEIFILCYSFVWVCCDRMPHRLKPGHVSSHLPVPPGLGADCIPSPVDVIGSAYANVGLVVVLIAIAAF